MRPLFQLFSYLDSLQQVELDLLTGAVQPAGRLGLCQLSPSPASCPHPLPAALAPLSHQAEPCALEQGQPQNPAWVLPEGSLAQIVLIARQVWWENSVVLVNPVCIARKPFPFSANTALWLTPTTFPTSPGVPAPTRSHLQRAGSKFPCHEENEAWFTPQMGEDVNHPLAPGLLPPGCCRQSKPCGSPGGDAHVSQLLSRQQRCWSTFRDCSGALHPGKMHPWQGRQGGKQHIQKKGN